MSLLIKLGDARSYAAYAQRLQGCGITQFQEEANFSCRLDNRHCFRVVAVTAEHILQDKTRHILDDLLKQSLPKVEAEERQQLVELSLIHIFCQGGCFRHTYLRGSILSVSYTHLDVYKRQVSCCENWIHPI